MKNSHIKNAKYKNKAFLTEGKKIVANTLLFLLSFILVFIGSKDNDNFDYSICVYRSSIAFLPTTQNGIDVSVCARAKHLAMAHVRQLQRTEYIFKLVTENGYEFEWWMKVANKCLTLS